MSTDAPIRRRLVITGRVQGVWYRGSLSEQAALRGLAGWVRNRADGSVEAVVEGRAELVEELRLWCHTGPPAARVESVEARPEEVEGLVGFEITG